MSWQDIEEYRGHGSVPFPGFAAPPVVRGALHAEVREAVEVHADDLGALDRRLDELAAHGGAEVYTAAFRVLGRLEVSADEALPNWLAVVGHARQLGRLVGRAVDLRVALADYFTAVEPRLSTPVLVEEQTLEDAETGSMKDFLTGLHNYRFLEHALPRELSQARRIGYPLAVVFLDLDDFKAFNDRFGHAAGNAVLRRTAETLRSSIRDADLACRFGGEELVLVLPGTDRFGALTVAQRVVERVAALGQPAAAPGRVVTVSAGVAASPADAACAHELLAAADAAMYRAKAAGKNRAVLYSTERRAFRRVSRPFVASCAGPGGAALRCEGRDVSEGGAYFVASSRLPLGHAMDMELRFPEQAPVQVACQARVVRCERIAERQYGVGAAITGLPSPDRQRLLLAVGPRQRQIA